MERINKPAVTSTGGSSICSQHDGFHLVPRILYRFRCPISRRPCYSQESRHGGQTGSCGQFAISPSDLPFLFSLARSTTDQTFIGVTDGNLTSFLGIPFTKPPCVT